MNIDYKTSIAGATVIPDDCFCTACSGLKEPLAEDIKAVVDKHCKEHHMPQSALHWCRCEQEQATLLADRWRSVNLPVGEPKTFESFQLVKGIALQACKDFAEGNGAPILTLQGDAGRGKSHLAEAILREAFTSTVRLRYEQVSDMLQDMRATFSQRDHALETHMAYYRSRDILVLDDLGAERATDWTVDILTSIVDERYRNGKRTVITTNKSYDQMKDTIGFRLASRIFDIHTGKVRLIVMTGGDWRRGEGVPLAGVQRSEL
jgi:DNA replication protein DnaC